MTSLSFRQVRSLLNLSSNDDLLSLIARVPHWPWHGDKFEIVVNRWTGPPGEPLTLTLVDDRYISDDTLLDGARCWVNHADFKHARGHEHAPYGPVFWAYNEDGPTEFSVTPHRPEHPTIPDTRNTQVISEPPPAVLLEAAGVFCLCGVDLADDSVTFKLAPVRSGGISPIPLCLQFPSPPPEALEESVFIWAAGVRRLLEISASDAKQLHGTDTSPPAETDTTYTVEDFGPIEEQPRGAPLKRRTLAVLVGRVINQSVVTMDDLPVRLEAMRPGGPFHTAINAWLEELSAEDRQRVDEIAGVSTASWPDCTKSGETNEHLVKMIWLCLAKICDVASVYDTDANKCANKVRSCFADYSSAHIGQEAKARLPSNTAVARWIHRLLSGKH
ncbi:hypothetical protein LLB57_002133 [Escherichia coli]|nr:hypothetical protein [Escherichia coli]